MTRPALPVLALLLAACSSSPNFEQIGYFEGPAQNRVYQLWAKEEVSEDELRSHVTDLSHAQGSVTVAYVYSADSEEPTDLVTYASSFDDANAAMLAEPGPFWRWKYIKSREATERIIDCAKSPKDNEHCKV